MDFVVTLHVVCLYYLALKLYIAKIDKWLMSRYQEITRKHLAICLHPKYWH